MLRHRLNLELHGSDGFTTAPRLIAVVGLFVSVALGVQMLLTGWYAGRMMPGVMAAGEPVGGLAISQARGVLQHEAAAYELKLSVAGRHYRATSAQLGVQFDTESTLAAAYNADHGIWPSFQPTPVNMSYVVNELQLANFSRSVADQVGVQPVDAGIVWASGKFQPIPDKNGLSIDHAQLKRLIEKNLEAPDNAHLQLAPRPVAADIQMADLGPTIAEAKQLVATPIVLAYKGQNYTPTANDIGQWLTFTKQTSGDTAKLIPQVDGAKLEGYIQGLAKRLNVAPVTQHQTVTNGIVNIQHQGVNGSYIDQNALGAAITAAVMASQPVTYAIIDYPIPFKTQSSNLISLDGVSSYIEVNLSVQHLWVWQNGAVIYDSPVTSGATGAGFPTATGLFAIYYKTTNTHLVGYAYGPRYNYDVAVQYWMPFYQGFGLHDASWRNGNFGGQDYYYGGSHGCINLPLATAAFLYNWSVIGTPVWVHT